MSLPVLEVRDLRHRFASQEVLRGISFESTRGEVLGIVGPDGAGKTTMLRCIVGLIRPCSGEVRILGRDPQDRTSGALEDLGYMPGRSGLYGDLTVDENLRFFGDLYWMDRRTWARRREDLLRTMDLWAFRDRRVEDLSGGMYQKAALVCALLHDPAILFLDEPTNGVDPASRAEIWERIGEFSARGTTFVVATSYLGEAARCTRAGILSRGRLVALGSPPSLIAGFDRVVLQVDPIEGTAESLWDRLAPERKSLGEVHLQGRRLRVAVPRERVQEVETMLERAGARARPVAPTFEDLFAVLAGEDVP